MSGPVPPTTLSPDACRAARAILRWSVADLVQKANVSPNSIQKVEAGETVRQPTLDRIVNAFERAGVEILPEGARRFPRAERDAAQASAPLRH